MNPPESTVRVIVQDEIQTSTQALFAELAAEHPRLDLSNDPAFKAAIANLSAMEDRWKLEFETIYYGETQAIERDEFKAWIDFFDAKLDESMGKHWAEPTETPS